MNSHIKESSSSCPCTVSISAKATCTALVDDVQPLMDKILVLGDHQVFRLAITEELDLVIDLKYKGVRKHNELGSGDAAVSPLSFSSTSSEQMLPMRYLMKWSCRKTAK